MEKALQKALASAEQLSAVHLEALASNKKINDADIKQLTWELNQLASTALSLSSAGASHYMSIYIPLLPTHVSRRCCAHSFGRFDGGAGNRQGAPPYKSSTRPRMASRPRWKKQIVAMMTIKKSTVLQMGVVKRLWCTVTAPIS